MKDFSAADRNQKEEREHELTRESVLADYQQVMDENSINALIAFHSRNKYLLMAYHQRLQKVLGRIVANTDRKTAQQMILEYQTVLDQSLSQPLQVGTNINMLMHLFGYFKKVLSKEEKADFLVMLNQYQSGETSLQTVLDRIYQWVILYQEPYLKEQTIFQRYSGCRGSVSERVQ